ncbi:MAG TPA: hypothetical protein DCQ87_02470 [Lachnospiraceae bacterium]|nr:hypothetical protein [Lachnospiraceae bacterium]
MTREELISYLTSRKKYLETIILSCQKKLEKAPEGHILASRCHGRTQYYFYNNYKEKRTYLSDILLAGRLISRDYHLKLLPSAENELRAITRFLNGISAAPIEEIYQRIPAVKRELIEPLCVDDETFAQQWASEKYTALDMQTGEEYTSNDSRHYRSKSELLIANALNDAGVPFRYECQLNLKGYGTVYPDFTVLNKRTRQVFYHEHLGMMEDSNYVFKNLQKINAYQKNGIMQGKQLILTYESENVRFDLNVINRIIEEFYL